MFRLKYVKYESRKEAARPTPLLTPRRTVQVAKEMRNYNISLLGLSETRWLQAGQMRLASGETLLYSRRTENSAPHSQGVALMLAPEAQRALSGWAPVCPCRLITTKFETKKSNIKLNVIHCYVPTNDDEDEKKHDFYQLQAVLDKRREKDIKILMGDFNANMGSDNTGYDVMGTQGMGKMNENGEHLADL
ncbi:hypothetical protein NHX12_017636 [Muraenolepis orangiensis]|uniref:Endonuclease/exonuclease/phosphatase domain-containing protein n=1 Tax=Muraenolepis orangiensis TaxID=630683 RepID=A0A9Q0EVK6_9TELE|nr:hypothetical protein NHX12_017636 [Muraenolepis orangiensis]